VVLQGVPPDFGAVLPGVVVTLIALPFSYMLFKNAEAYFADVV
jgi:lipopolysaccharide transport system permease protein